MDEETEVLHGQGNSFVVDVTRSRPHPSRTLEVSRSLASQNLSVARLDARKASSSPGSIHTAGLIMDGHCINVCVSGEGISKTTSGLLICYKDPQNSEKLFTLWLWFI